MRMLCCPLRSPWRASSWLPGGDLRSESVCAACIMASLRNATLLTGSSCFENLPVQIFSASVPEKLSITSLSYHGKREARAVRNGSGHTLTPTVRGGSTCPALPRSDRGQGPPRTAPPSRRFDDLSQPGEKSSCSRFCSGPRCCDVPDCGCIRCRRMIETRLTRMCVGFSINRKVPEGNPLPCLR